MVLEAMKLGEVIKGINTEKEEVQKLSQRQGTKKTRNQPER
jgi:hypothetical protein